MGDESVQIAKDVVAWFLGQAEGKSLTHSGFACPLHASKLAS